MVGAPQINADFWADITKILGTIIVALQAQHPQQHQPGSTQSFHTERRDNYNNYAVAAFMSYANAFSTIEIPIIWVNFQQSKELLDNRPELKKGMDCGKIMKRIIIEKYIFFFKLTLEDMVKLSFKLEGSVNLLGSADNGMNPIMVLPWGAQTVEKK